MKQIQWSSKQNHSYMKQKNKGATNKTNNQWNDQWSSNKSCIHEKRPIIYQKKQQSTNNQWSSKKAIHPWINKKTNNLHKQPIINEQTNDPAKKKSSMEKIRIYGKKKTRMNEHTIIYQQKPIINDAKPTIYKIKNNKQWKNKWLSKPPFIHGKNK